MTIPPRRFLPRATRPRLRSRLRSIDSRGAWSESNASLPQKRLPIRCRRYRRCSGTTDHIQGKSEPSFIPFDKPCQFAFHLPRLPLLPALSSRERDGRLVKPVLAPPVLEPPGCQLRPHRLTQKLLAPLVILLTHRVELGCLQPPLPGLARAQLLQRRLAGTRQGAHQIIPVVDLVRRPPTGKAPTPLALQLPLVNLAPQRASQ